MQYVMKNEEDENRKSDRKRKKLDISDETNKF